jgi:hypothetical protein
VKEGVKLRQAELWKKEGGKENTIVAAYTK